MKSRRLIGLPVIDEHRGTILGRVIDIIISPAAASGGLVIGGRGGKRLLLLDHLTIGQDAIWSVISGLKPVKKRGSIPPGLRIESGSW